MGQHPYTLFSGTSHPRLGKAIAAHLEIPLGKLNIKRFPDQEIGVQVLEHVRGRDVFVLQTIARHPNSYLMELLIIVDALKRASAKSVTAVIPYYGYARQDRKDQGRVPITAKLVANLLETAGVNRVIAMDLHAPQIQGFFDIPVDNLHALPVLIEAIRKEGLGVDRERRLVVVAPDIGSSKLAQEFSEHLGTEFAIIDKRRINETSVEVSAIAGDVCDADVLLIDDICSTGGTLKRAAEVCKAKGAKRVFAALTHCLADMAVFEESAIERFFVCDTVPDIIQSGSKVQEVSVAEYLAKAVDLIARSKSISSLFLKPKVKNT